MKKNNFLYWEYYILHEKHTPPVVLSFFDIGDYKDKYVFLHIDERMKFNIEDKYLLNQLEQYIYPISKFEEDMILDDMGVNGKRQYKEKLKNLNFNDNYKIYSFSITSESIYLLTKFLETTLEKPIKISISNLE